MGIMDNELYHYGILGMKWGIRRYQNKDGSLTEEGKKRQARQALKKERLDDYKNRSTFSDSDLNKKIARLNLEKQYRDITNEEVRRGRKFAESLMEETAKRIITTAVTGAVLYGLKAGISRKVDFSELANAVFQGGAKKK